MDVLKQPAINDIPLGSKRGLGTWQTSPQSRSSEDVGAIRPSNPGRGQCIFAWEYLQTALVVPGVGCLIEEADEIRPRWVHAL